MPTRREQDARRHLDHALTAAGADFTAKCEHRFEGNAVTFSKPSRVIYRSGIDPAVLEDDPLPWLEGADRRDPPGDGPDVMDRRAFLGALGLLAAPRAAEAQPTGKVPRVGFLYFGSRQTGLGAERYAVFLEGMRELGYVEGKNVVVEPRFADSRPERVAGLVEDLLRLKIDLIVATGFAVYRVLQRMAPTLPVVVTVTPDPVLLGMATTVARPGGNFTGLSEAAADLVPKQLELVKAVVPKLSKIGVLFNPDNVAHPSRITLLMLTGQKLGIQVVLAEAGTVTQIEPGFASLARQRADAVILPGDAFFSQQLPQIAESALKHRMPSAYLVSAYAEAGGLMSYGPSITENFRRAATYVDKILKGAPPGELPFEHPTRYVLAVNLKTAKALGLTISPSLLQRANQVIDP